MSHQYAKVAIDDQDRLGLSSEHQPLDPLGTSSSNWTEIHPTEPLTLAAQQDQDQNQEHDQDHTQDQDPCLQGGPNSRPVSFPLDRRNFSNRILNALGGSAPSSYAPLPEPSSTARPNSLFSAPSRSIPHSRPIVAGASTDGVFANLSAKPEVDGQKTSEQRPPTYESAVQDVTPPYFELTVVTPTLSNDTILVDGLPLGSIFQLLWNVAVSVVFQFLGVLLTYLLHNSHASKCGSMVGLGITLVHFGVRMRGGFGTLLGSQGSDPNSAVGEVTQVDRPSRTYVDDTGYIGNTKSPSAYHPLDSSPPDWFQADTENHWVSLVLMMTGWLILIKAIAAFAAAKRTEAIILSQPPAERERHSVQFSLEEHEV